MSGAPARAQLRASAPQFYTLHSEFDFLDRNRLRYYVRMNNHTNVEAYDSRDEASLRVAARNYAEGCFDVPGLIGLDGI